MKSQKKYNPSSGFIICIFYRTLANTLTPTLFKSKSFSFRVPKSHSAQSNVKLAIRPKKIISNMLVLIPVIKENKWYVNCFWIFFPFTQWTPWIIVTSADLPQLWIYKIRQKPLRYFPVSKILFQSSCAKLYVPTSGWTERFRQVHRRYFKLHSD